MKNTELGNSKLVFQFLGPIDWILHEEENGEGLWALLGGIASFLNPGHDDEVNMWTKVSIRIYHTPGFFQFGIVRKFISLALFCH